MTAEPDPHHVVFAVHPQRRQDTSGPTRLPLELGA